MGVAPSFLPDDEDPGWGAAPVSRAAPWLFVGRLGREKGILDLVRSWPTGHRLLIAGAGGEDHEAVADAAGPSVELLGQLRRADVLAIMRECRGLVFPSKWLEGSPLVVVEALAVGLPILAFEPTALAGTVEHDLIGRRVTRDADLAAVLADAAHAFSDLRGRCRTHFERVHSEAAFLARTESMYAAALR